jgi:hypothetical protein
VCKAYCACGKAPCGRAVAGEGASIVAVHGDTGAVLARLQLPESVWRAGAVRRSRPAPSSSASHGAVMTGVWKERTSDTGADVESAVSAGYPR